MFYVQIAIEYYIMKKEVKNRESPNLVWHDVWVVE